MVTEHDLIDLMVSESKLWSPIELTHRLDINLCDLMKLFNKANNADMGLRWEISDITYHTAKFWVEPSQHLNNGRAL